MSDVLFGKWLEETRKLQMEFFNTDPSALEGEQRDQYLAINNLAARDELSEALAEHSWKPWSSTKGKLNRREYIKEHVDALHFIANMLLAAKCTDEELNEYYLEKMQVNRDRQLAGYKNDHKCSICTRALDDVKESPRFPGICEMCVDL